MEELNDSVYYLWMEGRMKDVKNDMISIPFYLYDGYAIEARNDNKKPMRVEYPKYNEVMENKELYNEVRESIGHEMIDKTGVYFTDIALTFAKEV